jgi:hypothetical protein
LAGALKGREDFAMPQSLARNLVHLVFSTKNREPILTEPVRDPLCDYASAVLRDLDSHVIAINAWRDHVHILFALSKKSFSCSSCHGSQTGDLEMDKDPGEGIREFSLANRAWMR